MNALEHYGSYLRKLAVAKRLYAQSDKSRKSWVTYVAMAEDARADVRSGK